MHRYVRREVGDMVVYNFMVGRTVRTCITLWLVELFVQNWQVLVRKQFDSSLCGPGISTNEPRTRVRERSRSPNERTRWPLVSERTNERIVRSCVRVVRVEWYKWCVTTSELEKVLQSWCPNKVKLDFAAQSGSSRPRNGAVFQSTRSKDKLSASAFHPASRA